MKYEILSYVKAEVDSFMSGLISEVYEDIQICREMNKAIVELFPLLQSSKGKHCDSSARDAVFPSEGSFADSLLPGLLALFHPAILEKLPQKDRQIF